MADSQRLDEAEEEIAALRGACEQFDDAIGLLAEMLAAVVMAIPRDGARYGIAADRIDRILTHRDAMAGKGLGYIPRRIAEQLRDDLRGFAAMRDTDPDPLPPTRPHFRIIEGGSGS